MGVILAAGVAIGLLLVVIGGSVWLQLAGACAVVVSALAFHAVYGARGNRRPEAFRGGILLPPRLGYAAELLTICLVGAVGCTIVGVGSLLAEDGVRRAALLLICAPGLLVFCGFLVAAIAHRRGGLLLEPSGLTTYPILGRSRTVAWRDIFEVEADPLWDGWIGLRTRGDVEVKIGITAVALPASEVIGLVTRYAATPATRAELASLERFSSP